MSGPIIFISRHRVKEGKLADLEALTEEGMANIKATKPGTALQTAYVNEDGSEVSFVHVFPDSEAMEKHLAGADERANRSYEFMQPLRMEILGSPSEKVVQVFKQMEARGISLTLWPEYLGGFIRLGAA